MFFLPPVQPYNFSLRVLHTPNSLSLPHAFVCMSPGDTNKMQAQDYSSRFIPLTRLDVFGQLKESLNRVIVSDADQPEHPQRSLPRSGTGEESPMQLPPRQALVNEKNCTFYPANWSHLAQSSHEKRKLGPLYMNDDIVSNACFQDLHAYGMFAPRTGSLPSLPSPPASHMRYPAAVVTYEHQQPNSGYTLPPFACCEASLWRGRSEGLLAAAGRGSKLPGPQPIVIHNETSARVQNELVQESAPATEEISSVSSHKKTGTLGRRAWRALRRFLRSPLNLFAITSLSGIVAYCSTRYLILNQRRLTLRRHQRLLRRSVDRPSTAALVLLQMLLRSLSPHRRRIFNGRRRQSHSSYERDHDDIL
eukprot:Gregarina_sp_Poly_1__7283@NODE_3_length_27868_cov_154_961188_g2_i0_p9_GENE_NODE_3_length_27868_cov_154_961188_g2_i0NODE_3_length_27868_cov_154_961188_g2_i0_p9_ORF_typecomplete_len363_score24_15_NODE_3_length_27868_cov_154_961188_g2_i036184706